MAKMLDFDQRNKTLLFSQPNIKKSPTERCSESVDITPVESASPSPPESLKSADELTPIVLGPNEFEPELLADDSLASETSHIPQISDEEVASLIRTLLDPTSIQKHKLLPFQQYGVDWVLAHFERGNNPILADQMGLGKTIQTIGLISKLKSMKEDFSVPNNNHPIVIVCPTSTLHHWEMELKKWLGKSYLNVKVYGGDPRSRKGFEVTSDDIIICNYALLAKDIQAGTSEYPWLNHEFGLMVFDEGHCLKNPRSKRTKAFASLNVQHKLMLTGTPLQNNISELLNLIQFLNPHMDKVATLKANIKELMEAIKSCKLSLNRSKKPISHLNFLNRFESTRFFNKIRTITEFCNELLLQRSLSDHNVQQDLAVVDNREVQLPPPLVSRKLYYDLTSVQSQLYDVFARYWNVDVEESQASLSGIFTQAARRNQKDTDDDTGFKFFTLFHLLRRLVNTPYELKTEINEQLDELQSELSSISIDQLTAEQSTCLASIIALRARMLATEQLRSGKMETVIEKALEHYRNGESILIGCSYSEVESHLMKAFKKENVRAELINGQTNKKSRATKIERFNQSEEPRILVLAVRAAGEGLNLQKASVVISTDEEFNPSILKQFVGRANRMGQEQQVTYYQCESREPLIVEQYLNNLCTAKQHMINYFFANDPKAFVKEFIDGLLKEYGVALEGELHAQYLNKIESMVQSNAQTHTPVAAKYPSLPAPYHAQPVQPATAQFAPACNPESLPTPPVTFTSLHNDRYVEANQPVQTQPAQQMTFANAIEPTYSTGQGIETDWKLPPSPELYLPLYSSSELLGLADPFETLELDLENDLHSPGSPFSPFNW